MAHVLADRVRETATTTGTGTFTLGGAVTGFQSFSAGIGNGNTTFYCIAHQSAAEWEVGLGTLTVAGTTTLARTTVLKSSNSGSAVNFSAGTKDVFVVLPADRLLAFDGPGTGLDLSGKTLTLSGSGTLDTSGRLLLPGHSSFMAYKSARDSSGVTGDGTTATVVFDTENHDRGGCYNAATGIYTAAVAGVHQFGANVSSLGYDGSHTYSLIEIVTTDFNSRPFGTIFAAGKINSLVGGNQFDASAHLRTHLDAGDTVKVTISVAGSTKDVKVDGAGAPRTLFWGGLCQ